jgi:hypothetical protein
MKNTLFIGLMALFFVQLWVAGSFELAHDEAYYWLFSKNLSWGYFDHPPFVAMVIRLFSFLPHAEWSVRIGFIFLQFLSLLIIFKMIPRKSYWTTTLMFFSFPLVSFTGILALPDMPLLFMSALYCLALKNYLERPDSRAILSLSVVIPLLLYAKYHGILLIFFTLLALPKLLLRKDFYLITLLSIVLFSPHLWWQYQHDFSTLRYHFLERPASAFSLKRSLEYLAIQVGLAGMFIGPYIWWKTAKFKTDDDFEKCLKFMGFGIVIFFFISSFSKRVEANWTISVAVPLIILIARTNAWSSRSFQGLLTGSFILVVMARFLFLVNPQSLGLKRLKEFHGWQNWSQSLQQQCSQGTLMANNYQLASKLSYYLNQPIQALNYHSRKNQFDEWRFDRTYPTEKVCYITDKNEFTGQALVTPEGKELLFVTDYSWAQLQEIKARSVE